MKTAIPDFPLHEDLERLLDHRGLLRRVAEECGADYKRVHELIKERAEPRHSLGKSLEGWIHCASLLAATRRDLKEKRKIPYSRLARLIEFKEETSIPRLKSRISGIVELLGPSMSRISPSAEEALAEAQRDRSYQAQAKKLIDSSLESLLEEIETLLK